jgi:hypothetical protein
MVPTNRLAKIRQLNHEGHEEHEVAQCAIGDRAVTVRVNTMAATGLNVKSTFFVFLRSFVVICSF